MESHLKTLEIQLLSLGINLLLWIIGIILITYKDVERINEVIYVKVLACHAVSMVETTNCPDLCFPFYGIEMAWGKSCQAETAISTASCIQLFHYLVLNNSVWAEVTCVVQVFRQLLCLYLPLFPLAAGCWATNREGRVIRWDMPVFLNPSKDKTHCQPHVSHWTDCLSEK